MHIDSSEIDLLADPRYASGYWHVYPASYFNLSYRAAFTFNRRKIEQTKFGNPRDGAKWIIGHFKSIYGDEWFRFLMGEDDLAGPGWQIIPSSNGFRLHVCPCGIWCRVALRVGRSFRELFTSRSKAKKALHALNRYVWPMFPWIILEAKAYQTPSKIVVIDRQ